MTNNAELLFNQFDLRVVLAGQQTQLREAIDALSAERIFKADSIALAQEMARKYAVKPLALDETKITVDHRDVRLETSDYGRASYRTGTQVTFHVPFSGDAELF